MRYFRDPGKWPLLVVAGTPVTHEQANDILIRTNNWVGGHTNSKDWRAWVAELVGQPLEPDYWGEEISTRFDMLKIHMWNQKRFLKELGAPELEHLANERIYSSWIGGAKGWCNWDGTIGTSNYNVGKWPGIDEIGQEWERIAKAFPYLKLRSQLFPDEGKGDWPAVEYIVGYGTSRMVVPHDALPRDTVKEEAVVTDFVGWLQGPRWSGREIGVSSERLIEAVNQVRTARGLLEVRPTKGFLE